MREAFLGLLLVFAFNAFGFSSATVLLKPLSLSFPDLPAKNAVGVNSSGVCGALFVADPLDACSPLRNTLPSNKSDLVWFVLIIRGKCAFEEKALRAQNAGFKAAIVYDDRYNGDLVYMMINHDNISVHAVFISKRAGEILKEKAGGVEDECCIFPLHNGTAWTVLAISFISFIAIFALLLIAIFIPRHWLYSQGREHLSKRVDHKMVEALPCFTFSSAYLSSSSPSETCAICLEDYKNGEVLKVLPCQHDFHSSCVDSWLTKWGTFCPVCKHDMRNEFNTPRGICFNIAGISFFGLQYLLMGLKKHLLDACEVCHGSFSSSAAACIQNLPCLFKAMELWCVYPQIWRPTEVLESAPKGRGSSFVLDFYNSAYCLPLPLLARFNFPKHLVYCTHFL